MSYKEELFEKLLIHSAGINKTFVGSLTDVGRQQFDVEARNMCFHYLRKRAWGFTEIGVKFNRGHATVMHGVKKHNIAYDRGGYYMENYDDLVLLMSKNTDAEIESQESYAEKNRSIIERLNDQNGKLKEELFDVKKNTRLLLRSIKEQQSLTIKLKESCN